MRNLLLLILITSLSFAGSINIETAIEHMKCINSDAGLELLLKSPIRLNEITPIDFLGAYIGIGFSQQYTAPRSSQFAYNHYGDRFDWSIGAFLGGVECIYTHSIRKMYDGANPDVIFFNKDIDSIKFRYKTGLEF